MPFVECAAYVESSTIETGGVVVAGINRGDDEFDAEGVTVVTVSERITGGAELIVNDVIAPVLVVTGVRERVSGESAVQAVPSKTIASIKSGADFRNCNIFPTGIFLL